MKNTIPFTQYLRPNGRKRPMFFDCDENLAMKAQDIINKGFRFECEELMTGYVSLTISNGEEDVEIRIVPNGPKVVQAVQTLVENFHSRMRRRKRENRLP